MVTDSFASGSSIGPYRIVGRLGAGGMGEVYQAHDTKLGRDVALKVLPEAFVHDDERRIRLEREARVLASLNHPNIATLHGLQEFGDRAVLDIELVPGETLAERIANGPMSADEALPIFRQIASALEAAHDRGIIHRDLKPANVKVLPDGRVKVLDFGLAKVFQRERDRQVAGLSPSTATLSGGSILGTAQYMSPEQARGLQLDRRTDIWSFGCVLYEAFTGQAPFRQDTASDTLAAILKDEPDWRPLAHAPAPIQRLVRRCLRKDVQLRLRDMADARIEIEDALNETSSFLPVPRAGRSWNRRWLLAAAIAGVVTVLVALLWVAIWYGARDVPSTARIRVAIPVPQEQRFALGPSRMLALSPDGSELVYAATGPAPRTQLFRRPLDQFEAKVINGSDGATVPFFSPDGQWVGFQAGGALQKVSLSGGGPLKICDVPPLASATWGEDETILFATTIGDGIWRVAAGGGAPQQITRPDASKGETQHGYPQFLPGGDSALMTVIIGGQAHPAVLSLRTGQWTTIRQITVGAGARFVPVGLGYIVYAQSGGLVAVAFDPARGELRGSPVPLLERVDAPAYGAAQFAVARNGTLVYVPGQTTRPARTLMIVDREGRSLPLGGARASYTHPRFSPDGRSLAVTVETESGSDIWIHDLQRGTRTRLTAGGANGFPIWTPDGRSVTYYSGAHPWTLFARPADGSSAAQPLLTMERRHEPMSAMATLLPGTLPSLSGANPQFPMSWSGDGRVLAFTERKPSAERDIWVLEPGSEPAPFLVTSFDEFSPAFSRDGRYLAYVSDESGRPEVYVQPYPGPGGRWLISTDGGTDPVWSASGRELFYRDGDDMLSVPVQTTTTFTAGAPQRVIEARFDASIAARNYDVGPDGRFVMIRSDETGSPHFQAVFNWFAELQRRAPAGR